MIPVNELRIGNWFRDAFVGNAQVTAADLTEWEAISASPIPLTPEILEKCGFELELRGKVNDFDGVDKVYFKSGVDIYDNSEEQGEPMFLYATYTRYPGRGFKSGTQVKSLHHLQNIFHALTGTELEIKL